MFKQIFAVIAASVFLMSSDANAQSISGAGSTFAAPVYSKWSALERAGAERPTLDDVRETFELLLAAWVFAYSPVTQRRWEALA